MASVCIARGKSAFTGNLRQTRNIARYVGYFAFLFRNARVVSFFRDSREPNIGSWSRPLRASCFHLFKRESRWVCTHTLAHCVAPGLAAWLAITKLAWLRMHICGCGMRACNVSIQQKHMQTLHTKGSILSSVSPARLLRNSYVPSLDILS